MPTTPIHAHVQSPQLDEFVILYDVDATNVGGDVLHFTSSAYETTSVQWRGNTYSPIPIETDGWEWNGQGSLPTPTMKVANANGIIGGLVIAYSDLLGATVTRWRTFRRYLDGQEDADPDSHFPVDVFKIERKVAHAPTHIEWELSAAMDHEGRMIPGRQALRSCPLRYRRWTGTAFDYSKATCPYVGDNCFTSMGVATTSSNDKCGKKLSDCLLRYGTAELPFGGFPGVAKVRV